MGSSRQAEFRLRARLRRPSFATGEAIPATCLALVTALGAAAIFAGFVGARDIRHAAIAPLVVALAAALVAPFLGVLATKSQWYMPTAAVYLFAAVLLPPAAAELVAFAGSSVDWMRRSRLAPSEGYVTPTTGLLNGFTYCTATAVATSLIHRSEQRSWLLALGVAAGALAYVAIENTAIASYLALGRKQRFVEVLRSEFWLEFTVALIGATAALLWLRSPALTPLVLAPALLTRRVQQVPLLEEKAELFELEREAKERLLELDEMKREFIALVSHELKTPIASIAGFTEFLSESAGDWPDHDQDFLQRIQRNTTRLERLVGDLATLEAVERELSVAVEEIDLAGIVLDAVSASGPRAQEKGIEIKASCPAEMRIIGDGGRLAQVADNLITNAVKYTPEGGHVEVRLRFEEGSVAFEVCDDGYGMSPQDQERLFTRFYRTGAAKASGIPGTGLGLSIVKMIVERHGGRVAVDSAEGVGTTFRVELPFGVLAPRAAECEFQRV